MSKKIKFWLILVGLIAIIPTINAQYLLNNTYFNPIHIPKVTTDYLTDAYVGNGMTFTGQAYYSDGVLTKYGGCLTNSDGDKFYCGGFNPDFSVSSGGYQLYVPSSHKVAYERVAQNGSWQTVRTYDIEGKSFWVEGSTIHFVDDYSSPYPSSGNYSSGSSNSSSSDYNRFEATCKGCDGTGKCSRCNGTGWLNNYTKKCERCHNTGTCQNCAGVGKKYGLY